MLTGFFRRLIELAKEAEQAPPGPCVDVFLETVGYELADKAGLTAYVWGGPRPRPLVDELRDRLRAWRGVVQAGRAVSDWKSRRPDSDWRRHLAHVLEISRSGWLYGGGRRPGKTVAKSRIPALRSRDSDVCEKVG